MSCHMYAASIVPMCHELQFIHLLMEIATFISKGHCEDQIGTQKNSSYKVGME